MRSGIVALVAALGAVALTVAGLWAWQAAFDLVADWDVSRPDLAGWAVRAAAVAAFAGAQLLVLGCVAGRVYRRGLFDAVMMVAGAAVAALALVSAVACGLAGR